jgi:hypothetical protein
MGNPEATTLAEIAMNAADSGFHDWIKDRKNRRTMSHRFDRAGYVPVRNVDANDGLWKINGRRQVIYAKKTLSITDQIRAARTLTS